MSIFSRDLVSADTKNSLSDTSTHTVCLNGINGIACVDCCLSLPEQDINVHYVCKIYITNEHTLNLVFGVQNAQGLSSDLNMFF